LIGEKRSDPTDNLISRWNIQASAGYRCPRRPTISIPGSEEDELRFHGPKLLLFSSAPQTARRS
jgi:hypothetical protein